MVARNRLFISGIIGMAALGASAPAFAQDGNTAAAAEAAARDEATNAALLARLMERRALIVAAAIAEEDKRHALEFLDRQIAKVKGQSGR